MSGDEDGAATRRLRCKVVVLCAALFGMVAIFCSVRAMGTTDQLRRRNPQDLAHAGDASPRASEGIFATRAGASERPSRITGTSTVGPNRALVPQDGDALAGVTQDLARIASTPEGEWVGLLGSLAAGARKSPAAALRILQAARSETNARLRAALVRAIQGVKDRAVVKELLGFIRLDSSTDVRLAGLESLRNPTLNNTLDADLSWALPELMSLVESAGDDLNLRIQILTSLRGSITDDRLASEILPLLASDSTKSLRLAAIAAVGPDAPPSATEALITIARGESDEQVRQAALAALRSRATDPRVISLYRGELERANNEGAREWSALVLGSILPTDEMEPRDRQGILSSLSTVGISDPSPKVRRAALSALGEATDARSMETLIRAANSDGVPWLRATAIQSLGRMRRAVAQTERTRIDEVIDALANDPDPTVSETIKSLRNTSE